MRSWLIVLSLCAPVCAAEKAAYDSTGRIIALTTEGADLEVSSNLVAVLPGGKRVPIQVRRDRFPILRTGDDLAWSGSFELPDEGRGRFQLKAEEDESGVKYSAAVTAETPLEVDAIEFLLDLPRETFVNGRLAPEGAPAMPIPAVKPASPVFYQGQAPALRFTAASGDIALDVAFGGSHSASVVDRWDPRGRSFQLRVPLASGPVPRGATVEAAAALHVQGTFPAPPARLVLDAKPRYRFDGFGGNYCWNNLSPVSAYTLKNLKHFTDLTPQKSEALGTASDQKDVVFTAFRAGKRYALHILNLGGARESTLEGLPDAAWQPIESTEAAQFRERTPAHPAAGTLKLSLPGRSLVTLTAQAEPPAAKQ